MAGRGCLTGECANCIGMWPGETMHACALICSRVISCLQRLLCTATVLRGGSTAPRPCNLLTPAPAGSCACRAGAMWREATTWPTHSGGRRRWGRSADALATSTPSGVTGALTASPQLCRAPPLCLRQPLLTEQHNYQPLPVSCQALTTRLCLPAIKTHCYAPAVCSSCRRPVGPV